METYRTRVLYQVHVQTGEAHPNKEAMEKCLHFSRRFGLGKIFQLNGIPQSDYMVTYGTRHTKDGKKGRSIDETISNVKESGITMNQGKERRHSKTVRKQSVMPTDDHAHHEDIVKIQSRVRGLIGRKNSEKLRLAQQMEKESAKTSSAGGKKPNPSSVMGNKLSGRVGAVVTI